MQGLNQSSRKNKIHVCALKGVITTEERMRQTADGLPRLRQKIPDSRGETPTLSDINIAPAAFNLNQSSAVCLPLVSDCQRLIWVHSHQIDLQLDGAAELDQAFDRFPYLTQKQTAALAQRCSLHPDQVKVWFMVQRLRYGISWDYEDIRKVRTKLKSNLGKEELRNMMGEEVKVKKTGEVQEEQSTIEGRMMGENAGADDRLERKMMQEQLMKKEDRKVEEDKRNTQKKRKWITVAKKMGKKRMKQGDEGVVKRAREIEMSDEDEREWQASTQSLITKKQKKAKENKRLLYIQKWPAQKSFDEPPLTDSQTEPLKRVDVTAHSTPNIRMTPVKDAVTDVGKPKELLQVTDDPVVADGSTTSTQQQDSHAVDACALPGRIRYASKTRGQLAMMKLAFLHCQYPGHEDYNQLAMLIGIPRYLLVQWFADTRYYIKKGKPRWMNQEQHSQALVKIRYRQCLNALAKAQPSEDGENTTWKMKLGWSESFSEDESVQGPPE